MAFPKFIKDFAQLYSNICQVHYRKIVPIVEKTIKEFGYTYNLKLTFIQVLHSHIRRLKAMMRQVSTGKR